MSSHYQSSHYGGSHYASSHYGRAALVPVPFTPEPVHPPGMGQGEIRKRIIEEDEMLLAVIMAFLQIKDE